MTAVESIGSFLQGMRRRLYRRSAAVAAGFTVAGLGAAVLGGALLAAAVSAEGGRRVGMWLLVVAVAGAAAGLWFGWLRPRRIWRRDPDVARWVGGVARPLASDLLSAVELRAARGDHRFSPALIDGLLDQVAGQVDRLQNQELLPEPPVRRARQALLLVGALWAVAVLAMPGRIARGWDRMLHAPPPGPFGGAAVVDVPLVGDLHVTLRFPAHSGRPPLDIPSSSGDFRAMPGTAVSLRTTSLLPVRAARIVFGEDERGEHLELAVDGNRLSAELTVREATVYRFLIEDEGGDRHVERAGRRIEIEPDQPPRVELYAPAEELDVSAMKRIELAWVAEDDFGIIRAELVIEPPGAPAIRRPVPGAGLSSGESRRSAQGKFLWDLAEVDIQPGTRVAYHLEVADNDGVSGPNIGRSREYHLRVFSPRERHEKLIERQEQLFEHVLGLLGDRLIVDADALDAHDALQRVTADVVVEIGGLAAALGEDRMASPKLVAALTAMRQRLDGLSRAETRLLAQLRRPGVRPAARLVGSDRAQVLELEEDSLTLADWLDRQRLELLLAISDEIAAHKDRLRELFKEYARTGSEAVRKEIERELRALEQKLAELEAKRGAMPADVLDEFVNPDAMAAARETASCTEEVRKLLAAGDGVAAQKKMEECAEQLAAGIGSLENALEQLRGDRFSEQERRYEELMDELADLAHDQSDIAAGADKLWQRYAERADELMRDTARETRERVRDQIERLEKQVARVPGDGLTQFSTEELALVKKRIADVREMLGDGDIAEALAMAKQAESGLETIDAELQATLEEEDDDSPWAKRTQESLRAVKKAGPTARKLIELLEESLPAPDEIMDPDDRRAMDQLRRQQQAVRERARRLGRKAEQAGTELPGTSAEELRRGLDEAGEPMERATDRMRKRDPSGARQEAREAAERLEQTRKDARGAARQQERGRNSLTDEPVRIPGADEYRPPEEFREQLLEAMKKEKAPEGYDELVRRYYEELIK